MSTKYWDGHEQIVSLRSSPETDVLLLSPSVSARLHAATYNASPFVSSVSPQRTCSLPDGLGRALQLRIGVSPKTNGWSKSASHCSKIGPVEATIRKLLVITKQSVEATTDYTFMPMRSNIIILIVQLVNLVAGCLFADA